MACDVQFIFTVEPRPPSPKHWAEKKPKAFPIWNYIAVHALYGKARNAVRSKYEHMQLLEPV